MERIVSTMASRLSRTNDKATVRLMIRSQRGLLSSRRLSVARDLAQIVAHLQVIDMLIQKCVELNFDSMMRPDIEMLEEMRADLQDEAIPVVVRQLFTDAPLWIWLVKARYGVCISKTGLKCLLANTAFLILQTWSRKREDLGQPVLKHAYVQFQLRRCVRDVFKGDLTFLTSMSTEEGEDEDGD